MESSVRRRMEALSRHLLQPREENTGLHQVLLKGVELEKQVEPVIIGGMVLDIHATPSVPANPRTTTPGKVHYREGGVARNVAECMSKLGAKPYMISAVGLDMAGNLLLEPWKSAELSTEGIRRQQDISTAVVSNIFDAKGEVVAGVASVEAIEKFLTPEWIRLFKRNISSAPVLMVDANLSPPALEASCRSNLRYHFRFLISPSLPFLFTIAHWLIFYAISNSFLLCSFAPCSIYYLLPSFAFFISVAAESNVPVWFETVSVTKSRRIASVAKYISATFPNEDELVSMANALSGQDIFHPINRDNKYSIESLFQTLKPAIWVLLEKGIRAVVVTLGPDGVFLCSKGGLNSMKIGVEGTNQYGFSRKLYDIVNSGCPSSWYSDAMHLKGGSQFFAMHIPALPASVVRLTGAGDCLVGGTLASVCAGLDVIQSVAVGIAAAKAAVEAETNVPSEFSLTAIADDARTVYAGAKVLYHQSML
ncbi:uncharacterized protein LOC116125490 isoform X1 [Pistacia vera]|uniref:uncharacterized protein LOC116125490 isoform X1 n=1 Tax=Pistacia vera TaxID=55513 RepID=UPI0012631489|nr:uncharacterized protein LOC116125490 isoform X1 [Pistacia vera]